MSDEPRLNGLQWKDFSDWLKVALMLGGLLVAYVRLSDQVASHTGQINQVQEQIGEMRKENRTRDKITNRKLGSIEMYLCSKDAHHCDPNDLTPEYDPQ